MAGVNTSSGAINKNAPSPQTGTALSEGDTKLVVQAATWPPLPSFRKGEAPTLLDAAEALKVKMFIENFLLNFTGVLRTGSPERNQFEWVFNPWGNNLDLWIQTDLIHDLSPQLGGHLDVNRHDIFSRGAPLYLDARNAEAVFIVGSTGYHGELRFGGANRNDYVGFRAGSAPAKIIWELPNADGSNGQVLTTNGAAVLSWTTKGGGGGGGGTVTSVATSNGTFVNITGGTITTSGTITGDLSATGSASSSTFLRGDNTWDVPSLAAGSTYEVQMKAVDGTFGASGVFAKYSGEIQLGGASTHIGVVGTEALNFHAKSSWMDFVNFPTSEFGQGIKFYNDYLICESEFVDYNGVSIVKKVSASDHRVLIDFFHLIPFAGYELKSITIGHSHHQQGGGFNAGTYLDVYGKLLLRGSDPDVDDDDYVLLEAASGSNPYTITLPQTQGIGGFGYAKQGLIGASGDLDWMTLLISAEAGQAVDGTGGAGLWFEGDNSLSGTETRAINNGDKIRFTSGNYVDIDYTPARYAGGVSNIHTFHFSGGKSAIVKSIAPDPDAFVAVYCTESPEVRFEDVITIDVDGRREFDEDLCPEFAFSCEPDSIQAIGHTTSEPALVGLKVNGGKLAVTFSELTDPPAQLVVHLSGIRSGADGIRHGKKTRAAANWNNAFWQIASQRPELCPPLDSR